MSTSDKQRQQQPDEVDEAKGSEHSAQLEAALKSGTLSREDLRTIYSVKSQTFLSDNNRIWTTAAIVIPLAFGAAAALEANKDATSWQRLVAGLVGLVLLVLWNLFADRHRALQDRSQSWLRSIETAYGCPPELVGELRGSGRKSIRTYRWLLALLFASYPLFNLVKVLLGI